MAAFINSNQQASAVVRQFSHVEISTKSTETNPDSKNLTNEQSGFYTALRKRPSHRWTLAERETLCVLWRWYCNSPKELAKVFNGYFSTKSRSDHHLEVTGSALAVQLYEMQRHGVKAEAFISVYIETLFVDEFCVWSDIKRDLEQTAKRLFIVLERRKSEDKEELSQRIDQVSRKVKRKKALSCVDSVLGNIAFRSEDTESDPSTPRTRPRYLTPSPTPQKGSETQHNSVKARKTHYRHTPATPQSLRRPLLPGSSSLKTEVEQLPRPQLVFRFYNNNSSGVNAPSGMRAGLFQDQENIYPPPDINSKAFRKEAATHFSWTQEPTPFISMYESILPVLHRGLLSTIDACIAVIDLHTVSRSRNHSKVYAGAHIIKRLGLQQVAYGYRARSEWLVWGIIEKEAIVTTFKVENLRRYLTGSPDVCIVLRFPDIESSRNADEYRKRLKGNLNQVGKAAGRVIGKFLGFIELPESYVESAAKKVARDWQLEGNKSQPRLKRYLEGVRLGLGCHAKAKQRVAQYLKQVDIGLQRSAADVPSERATAKRQMTHYLRRVDSGLGRNRQQVELSSFGEKKGRTRVAAYLRRIDLGQTHVKGKSSAKRGAPDLSSESDLFLSKRRRIEVVCSGS
jgi:hypothetical protein